MKKTHLILGATLIITVIAPTVQANNECCANPAQNTCSPSISNCPSEHTFDTACQSVTNSNGKSVCQLGCCCASDGSGEAISTGLVARMSCDQSFINQSDLTQDPFETSCAQQCGIQTPSCQTAGETCSSNTECCSGHTCSNGVCEPINFGGGGDGDGNGSDDGSDDGDDDGGCTQDFTLQGTKHSTGEGIKAVLNWYWTCGTNTAWTYIVNHSTSDEQYASIHNTVNTYYNDSSLASNTIHKYRIIATHPSEQNMVSNEISLTIPHPGCPAPSSSYCDGNTLVTCDQNQLISNTEQCADGDGQICTETGQLEAQCTAQPPCRECNGLYGMYSSKRTDYLVTTINNQPLSCQEATEPQYGLCYTNKGENTVNYKASCTPDQTCAAYDDPQTCRQSPCHNTGNCQWKTVYGQSANDTLQLGVCGSTGGEACRSCDDLANCNKHVCQALGPCYYDVKEGSDNECIPISNVTCADYNTQNQCENGRPVAINYTVTNGQRNGNNAVLNTSNDMHNIGKCKWKGDYCIKDGDGNDVADCEGGIKCGTDTTPPTTVVMINEQRPYSGEEALSYSASDDTYDAVNTYYSFEGSYPIQTVTDGTIPLTVQGNGTKTLRIYSEDPANNKERIQRYKVRYDTKTPRLFLNSALNKTGSQQTATLEFTVYDHNQLDCSWNLQDSSQSGTFAATPSGSFTTKTTKTQPPTRPSVVLTATCEDPAGNKVTKQRTIDLDSNITNIKPDLTTVATTTPVLNITTAKQALCRYSTSTSVYAQMQNNFTTAPATHHTQQLSIADGWHEYNLACTMIDGTLIQGRDKASFAVDTTPPTTNVSVNGQPTPDNTGVIVQSPEVTFACDDNTISHNSIDYGFGCNTFSYCVNVSTCNYTQRSITSGATTLNLENLPEGNHTLRYYSADTGGNEEPSHAVHLLVDSTTPSVVQTGITAPTHYFSNATGHKIGNETRINVSVQINDNTFKQVCIWNDDLGKQSTTNCANALQSDNTTTLPVLVNTTHVSAQHNIFIEARDRAGNMNTSQLAVLREINVSAPSFTLQ